MTPNYNNSETLWIKQCNRCTKELAAENVSSICSHIINISHWVAFSLCTVKIIEYTDIRDQWEWNYNHLTNSVLSFGLDKRNSCQIAKTLGCFESFAETKEKQKLLAYFNFIWLNIIKNQAILKQSYCNFYYLKVKGSQWFFTILFSLFFQILPLPFL